MRRGLAALLACAIAAPPRLPAQGDTARAAVLDTVLITGERAPMTLGTASAAATRIAGADLARMPHATLADALRLAPGFTLVDFDGMGFAPQIMVRGFYGGGEAEYVVVLLDGRPVHQVHTGLVAWDALPPPGAVEAVEVVRGSASAVYGDAAVGAVINIITRPAGTSRAPRWSATAGSHDSWRASADLAGIVVGRAVSIGGGADHTAGFRTHARRTVGRLHAGVQLRATEDHAVSLFVRSHWRAFDEPGPLLDSILELNRRASDPLFRFDHTSDHDYAVALSARRTFGGGQQGSASITAERRYLTAKRTLALTPGFGDTKERRTTNGRVAIALQHAFPDTPLPGADRLTVGADISRAASDSRYYAVLTGDRDAYRAASGERDSLASAGDAGRDVQALFAQWSVQPTAAVRVTLGGRFDLLNDMFEPRSAGDTVVAGSHKAFSPKVGLNVRYLNAPRASGNAYLTASRSFKAPTLDQLFDQRSIPVAFPPYAVTTSNPQLEPQSGWSIEGGLYHRASLGRAARLGAMLSVYQMDMKDELDFDVQTFRYVNIGRSRHRGVEAGVTLTGRGAASAFVNYALQAVTARSGANAGNALKAIPRHALTGGLSVAAGAVDARLIVSHARDAYLDDANTVSLPPYTRIDAAVAYRVGSAEVVLDAANLFDARYSSTGFLDPSGTSAAYFYPAAGRVVRLGIRSGR